MTATPSGPEQRNEDEVRQLAGQALQQVKPLSAAVLALPVPQSTSSLVGDDRAAAPYKPSQAARRALGTAVEHLDALRELLVTAGVQHPAAPFTLLRASIETAATAIWVLSPPSSRPHRVERALQLALQDTADQDKLERTLDLPPARPFVERKASIQAVADRAIGAGTKLRFPKVTDIVRSAETEMASKIGLLGAWQICSGFAHGRLWAALAVLDREEIWQTDEGDVTLRTTSSTKALTWATIVAVGAISHGIQLYRQRATSPYSR